MLLPLYRTSFLYRFYCKSFWLGLIVVRWIWIRPYVLTLHQHAVSLQPAPRRSLWCCWSGSRNHQCVRLEIYPAGLSPGSIWLSGWVWNKSDRKRKQIRRHSSKKCVVFFLNVCGQDVPVPRLTTQITWSARRSAPECAAGEPSLPRSRPSPSGARSLPRHEPGLSPPASAWGTLADIRILRADK